MMDDFGWLGLEAWRLGLTTISLHAFVIMNTLIEV